MPYAIRSAINSYSYN
ncbi:uncharacterized protein FFB20_15918 [Fusarium fujikuroi]|nr:uncharacterized protein FFB20_15918 [Fusarium fujikuroi]